MWGHAAHAGMHMGLHSCTTQSPEKAKHALQCCAALFIMLQALLLQNSVTCVVKTSVQSCMSSMPAHVTLLCHKSACSMSCRAAQPQIACFASLVDFRTGITCHVSASADLHQQQTCKGLIVVFKGCNKLLCRIAFKAVSHPGQPCWPGLAGRDASSEASCSELLLQLNLDTVGHKQCGCLLGPGSA